MATPRAPYHASEGVIGSGRTTAALTDRDGTAATGGVNIITGSATKVQVIDYFRFQSAEDLAADGIAWLWIATDGATFRLWDEALLDYGSAPSATNKATSAILVPQTPLFVPADVNYIVRASFTLAKKVNHFAHGYKVG